jgi:hypothetical protein
MSKRIAILVLLVSSCTFIRAQSDVTLPSLRRLYQSSYINPAFVPKYKLSVGVPVLSNFYINNTRTGFSLQDIIDCKDDEGLIDLNKFYGKIKGDKIGINTLQQMDIFHVSFALGKFHMSVNSSVKTQTSQEFSKDFIGFLVNGNSFFKGQTASFKGVEIYNMSYLENGISLSRQFKKFSLGVRGKYLQGIAMTTTKDMRFSVTTPEDPYDPLIVRVGGQANTAGVPLLMDSVSGKVKRSEDKDFDANNLSKFANNGFAFDLGFTCQVLPRLLIHGSVVDWGGITWKSTPYNYTLKEADVQFGGFTKDQIDNPGQRTDYTDSLLQLLGQATVTDNSFKTNLRTRYFAGADYDLTFRDRVGFLFQGQQTPTSFNPAYTLSYTRKVGSNWDITGNYSIFNETYANFGLGTAVKWGAFQIYFISDDIMIFMRPNTAQTFYFRFGFNLVWSELEGKAIADRSRYIR